MIEFGYEEVDWPTAPVAAPDEHVRFVRAGSLAGEWFGHVVWREADATVYLLGDYQGE